MSENKTFSAGGIVINPTGKVLLVQEYGLYWGLPRGHIKNNESPAKAAIREIYEETGVSDLRLIKELGSYTRYRFDENGNENYSELKHITIFLFSTRQERIEVHDSDITAAEWVEMDDATKRFIYYKDIDFYNACIGEIRKPLSGS